MTQWLITGGCGFIGGNLLLALLRGQKGGRIRILDNFSVGTRGDLESYISEAGRFVREKKDGHDFYRLEMDGAPQVELQVGDIRDEEAALKAVEGVEVVVHLAANTGVQPSIGNPRLDFEINVVGVFNLLEACRQEKIGRFIFASSGAVVGETEPPIHEEKAPRPVSPYGASKLAGEAYCSAYARTFGIRTVALRFGNVYGPLSMRKSSVVAKYIKRGMQGLPLEIYGDGTQTRDFIFIDDLVDAILRAVRADVAGEVFQIATHKETTVLEIAAEVKRLFKEETGADVEVVHRAPLAGDVRRNYSDISKARKVLGFEPRFDLPRGLRKTLDYFLQRRDAF
jgi:UDP-glucose 4-epimerase